MSDKDGFEDDDGFVTETVVWEEDDSKALERTIQAMENSHVCVHPGHYHSFQQVNFMLSLSKCAGCDQSLPNVVFGGGNDTSKHVVRCVACGALAHRKCALSRDLKWPEPCLVNAVQISNSASSSPVTTQGEDVESLVEVDDDDSLKVQDARGKEAEKATCSSGSIEKATPDTNDESVVHVVNQGNEATDPEIDPAWTQEGPPQHWASNPQSLPTITFPASDVVQDGEADDNNEHVHVTPLHYANHPFASVSRALQENVIAHFRRHLENGNNGDNNDSNSPRKKDSKQGASGNVTKADIVKALEAQVEPTQPGSASPNADQENPLVKLASETYAAVRTSVNMPRRIGAVAVAGGIAGGVAGLAIAGPAGAIAGSKLGQAAGALGVILEGSVSIGVFVASVATAGFTAQQIQEQINGRRILTMGEDGTARKVMLVRPNIQIDPVWEQIVADARSNAPKPPPSFSLYPGSDAAKSRQRYRRDSDIVRTAEDEIPTTEKILLLVSRMLNDKSSLPGHVYRFLIDAFIERCKERTAILETNPSIQAISPRARRDDAHAVIKHVTAALLEVRPGFASSPAFTELTATAVESLVFGRLYDLVFSEIASECRERDAALVQKIKVFEEQRATQERNNTLVSLQALDALRLLPQGHSAVDKLHYCVTFLELISKHFSGTVCADSLLKMACQHILVAKLSDMNAQIAFLEEFARDGQLLRGREGYSLVTLQASLHFLNMSDDIEYDIFGQDDDEENVPVVS